MESLIEAIRAATTSGANDDARAAGAHACRTILIALEAKPGESLAPVAVEASPMQAVVAALRGMPPEQLLDLAIARLKAALPEGAQAPSVQPVKFQLLPVAPLGGRS